MPAVTASASGSRCSCVSTTATAASDSTAPAITGNHSSAARSSTATSTADSTPRLFECIPMPAVSCVACATCCSAGNGSEYSSPRYRTACATGGTCTARTTRQWKRSQCGDSRTSSSGTCTANPPNL